MRAIFVVDTDSENLAEDLNSIAKREKIDFRFSSFTTPERFFRELERGSPDLVLLHHHWSGVRVGQLLRRIAEADDSIRVVVFTGQTLDTAELIECVRFGVADYWTERGKLDHGVVFRKIEEYCHNSMWTIKSLRVPSQPMVQLLADAEASVQIRKDLEASVVSLKGQLRDLRSPDHRAFKAALMSGIKFSCNTIVLTGAFIVANMFTNVGVWPSIALVGVIALCMLILEGKISEALLKARGTEIRVKANR